MDRRIVAGYVLALVAAILWGVSGTAGQALFQEKGLSAGWLVTFRQLTAGSLLLLFAWLQNGRLVFAVWKERREIVAMLLFGVFGMFAVQYTYFVAIEQSNAATATVLQYLGPIFIVLWYALIARRWPRWRESVALVLACVGTFSLVTHGRLDTLSITPLALFWGVTSAIALASYTILPVSLLRRHRAPIVVGWGLLVGGVFSSILNPPWQVQGVWDAQTWKLVFFVVLFGTLIAFFAYLTAVKIVGAQTSSLLACAEPLSAILMAVWWLNVEFGFYDWLGSGFIILTILVLSLGERSART